MTDVGRMSVGELVGKVMADEHADVLRQAVCWLAQELMEAEVSERAGAGYGQRRPDRVARRNGYRERAWDTRVGSIELAIPSCGKAHTSRASWSRAGAANRRWSPSSRRPTSTASPPVRSTGWSKRWDWLGCPRTPSRGCAAAWTSRSPPSASGR
jgi:Transposase, Mutator family